jgi:hypothetical protein
MRNRIKPLFCHILITLLFTAAGTVVLFSGCASRMAAASSDYAEEPYESDGRVIEENEYAEKSGEQLNFEQSVNLSPYAQQRMQTLQSRIMKLSKKKAELQERPGESAYLSTSPMQTAEDDQGEKALSSTMESDNGTAAVKHTDLPDSTSRAQKRMVHYDGSIRERSSDPEAILDSAKRFVRSIGGVIVSFSNQNAVFNIPVEKFRYAFDSLCTFAEVIAKSISAEDITEQFRDVEVRIKIAKATIERLKALIAKEENDTVKLRLLNEVKMISETLERLTRKREILQGSAEYSTIALEVLPHHPQAMHYNRHELRGFQWINEMTPLNAESRATGCYLKLAVPAGMVPVKSQALGRKLWRASSADGAEFWSWKRKNKPVGTTEFWFSALVTRKKDEYADIDTLSAGTYKILRLRSYGAEPYVYCIGVRSQGKKINVVEAYFPSQRQEERYKPAILAVLAGGAP